MSWFSRIANVFRGGAVDRELDEERRFHLDSRIDALMRDGLTREAAAAHASRQFGRPLALREASRDVKLMPWLDALFRDIRFGLRLLRKDAVVAVAAIVSLALAIGACIAAFSLVDALMLRPLPVREPHGLVYLGHGDPNNAQFSAQFNYPLFEQLRDTPESGVDLFGMSLQSMTRATIASARGGADAAGDGAGDVDMPTRVQWVSGSAFRALGISSAIGRVLTPDDDRRAGDHPVAVISHGYWTRVFGRDVSTLGRWIRFGGQDFQVVGVAEERFTGTEPGFLTDVWVPVMMWIRPGQTHQVALANDQAYWLRIWGRLQPGAEPERARAVLQGRFTNFQRAHVSRFGADEPRERVERFVSERLHVQAAANGVSRMREMFARPLLVLGALVALVLLIACSNVANLLIARSAAREHELMLRASLGASRLRLAQQALVESGLLVACACAVGLIFAGFAAPLLVSLLTPSDNPVYLDLGLDWRVLAFVAALGAITTVLFGLGPARRAASVALNAGAGSAAGHGGSSMTHARHSSRIGFLRPLIAAQIAFSLTTLFVAGLLLMSFDKLTRVDLGLSAPNLLIVGVGTQPEVPAARAGSVRQAILDRVRQIAGVESASLSRFALLQGSSWGVDVRLPGRAPETFMPSCLSVTPDFFRTMGIRLLEGREFTSVDAENPDPETPSGVVVNEAFVRRYFPAHAAPGRSALGQRFGRVRATVIPQEIIGVVADAKYADVRGAAPPTIYVPHREPAGSLQVRTRMDPAALASILRRELPRLDASLQVGDVMRQSTLVDNLLLRERLLALLSGFFALVGIVLAAVGLYGVISYAVVRRTREIGIRLALGAPRVAVVRSVLTDIVTMTIVGIAGGLAGGLFLSRFVRTLLYEVQPLDVSSLVLPTASLLVVGVLAALVPARRALRIEPIVALRTE